MSPLALFLATMWLIFLLGILYILLRPVLRGAVYFPTSEEGVRTILMLGKVGPGTRLLDLGSGDGRILIASAKARAEAVGYEINPLLVARSRRAIRAQGLENEARVCWKSFWSADLSPYDVIVIYGMPRIMKTLGAKLAREAKPGARIISNIYEFPNWEKIQTAHGVHLYIKGGA